MHVQKVVELKGVCQPEKHWLQQGEQLFHLLERLLVSAEWEWVFTELK